MTCQFDKLHQIKDLAKNYDVLLFDIWGVVMADQSNKVIPEIRDTMNHLIDSMPVYFISNSAKLAQFSASYLRSNAVNVTDNMVFTSGSLTRELLGDIDYIGNTIPELKGQKLNVYHLGSQEEFDALSSGAVNYTNNLEDANLLVISSYRDHPDQCDSEILDVLQRATTLKIPAICPNPDAYFTSKLSDGYCAGYFASMYERAGNRVFYVGKPHQNIFLHVFKSANLDYHNLKIMMIGDTLTTDVLGGQSVGIDTALVTTGNAGKMIKNADNVSLLLSQLRLHCQLHRIYPDYIVSLT